VEEADCCDLGSMLLHCQFRIEQNAKVAHDVGELDRSLHIDSKWPVLRRSCWWLLSIRSISPRSCQHLAIYLQPSRAASLVTSATQSLSCCRSLKLSSSLALASSCVSSAYMCGKTVRRSTTSTVSSCRRWNQVDLALSLICGTVQRGLPVEKHKWT